MKPARKTLMVSTAAHARITELSRRYKVSTVVVFDALMATCNEGPMVRMLEQHALSKRESREERQRRRDEAAKLADTLSLQEIQTLRMNPDLLAQVRLKAGASK